jgi:hypothetical protein
MVAVFLVLGLVAPPRALECLARHSGLAVRGEALVTAAGVVIPWDDGRRKTWDEAIETPDLEDTLSRPYRRGPPEPVTREDDEPGRARSVPLMEAVYGRRGARLPLVTVPLGGGSVRVHERVAPALRRVAVKLSSLGVKDAAVAAAIRRPAGGFADRAIAGSERPSAHAWGIAVDLDVSVSDYWRWAGPRPVWRSRIPASVVEAFESEGFVWGGRWYHFDTMHFEYRPELLDPACAP